LPCICVVFMPFLRDSTKGYGCFDFAFDRDDLVSPGYDHFTMLILIVVFVTAALAEGTSSAVERH